MAGDRHRYHRISIPEGQRPALVECRQPRWGTSLVDLIRVRGAARAAPFTGRLSTSPKRPRMQSAASAATWNLAHGFWTCLSAWLRTCVAPYMPLHPRTSARCFRSLFHTVSGIGHVDRDTVVADANQELFVRGGEKYRLTGPVPGGYAELIITPDLELLSEIAHVNGRPLTEHPLFTRRSLNHVCRRFGRDFSTGPRRPQTETSFDVAQHQTLQSLGWMYYGLPPAGGVTGCRRTSDGLPSLKGSVRVGMRSG